ncbi:hypothetical protein EDD85DRAFT_953335 [Armillaria nabsnona]|nr:hypothetical protein EDD85DRAFT_953335 [Armillaria nabsnona]
MVSHWEEHDGYETLIAAVFPGPLNRASQVRVREVCMNSFNNWIALDLGEESRGSPLDLCLGRSQLSSGLLRAKIELLVTASVTHCVERLLWGFKSRWKA